MEDFAKALAAFLDRANQLMDQEFNSSCKYPNMHKKLSSMPGSRYIRIVVKDADENHGSAWCFIDKTNGDVLKTASWKSPAKNFPRGNIYKDDNGLGRFDWTGIR